MPLKLQSTQRIVDEKNRIIMAEGRMALLEHIVETGSINQAAKLMKMSYKSAWSKIRSTEKHFKIKIVSSDKSTGTRLTKAGEDLLQKYRQVKQECLAGDDAAFHAIFHPSELNRSQGDIVPNDGPPIVSFVGHSGSGKTTIVEKVISKLTEAGLKVAVIKHDVHGFEMDRPGKDSWRHKKAGAVATAVSNSNRIGIVMDADHDHRPAELAPIFYFADLIITEGYKREPHPKIEIFRPDATGDKSPLCLDDPQLLAIISDTGTTFNVPVFETSAIATIVDFIVQWWQDTGRSEKSQEK
jgi:molybdopterin-guanine dinucleotide biosynthesis protein B